MNIALSQPFTLTTIAVYLIVINLLCYGIYAYDKFAAKTGRWRIAEAHLHIFALIGGWPAAILAQQRLRHKTRKQPFRTIFYITVVVNSGLIIVWLFFFEESLIV